MNKFPDANDRSVNNPCVLIDSKRVIKMYNETHRKHPVTKIGNSVKQWLVDKAKEYEWYEIKIIGGQCLLISNL